MIPIIIIISIGILILVHEFGHFLAAKVMGIRVKEFAVGFGPALVSFGGGETKYRINALLLGGYVKFYNLGDDSEDKGLLFEGDELETKPFFQKAVVVVSGVVANLVVALLVLLVLAFVYGTPQTIAKLGRIFPNGPAAEAGFRSGDIITEVDGEKIDQGEELARIIGSSADREIEVVVDRAGERRVLRVTPAHDRELDRAVIGVRIETTLNFLKEGLVSRIVWAFGQFGRAIGLIIIFLGQLFTAKASIDTLAGPIGMVKISSEVAQFSLYSFIFLQAFISINLAVLNLLPLPPLDGGRLLLYGVEAVRRRPLSYGVKGAIIGAGVIILLTLFVFVTFNDIERLVTGKDFLP
ncbi:MAG: RIP metalloprotease RseP [Terriglobia bacterium]